MAKAYSVVCYRSISDPTARDAYTKLAGPAVLASGGRFLARGLPAKTYMAASISAPYWSSSTASTRRSLLMTAPLQAALAVLGNAAERDLRIVEGIDG